MRTLHQDIEYVDVRPNIDHHSEPATFYEKWIDQSSAKHANPELIAADALRRIYPDYSLVVSDDYRLTSLLEFPGVSILPPDSDELDQEQVSNVVFTPISRRIGGKVAGALVDNIILGIRKLAWNSNDFIVHIAKFQNGNFIRTIYFILHNGSEQVARDLVLATCLHAEQTHEEIWVFNRGFWLKSKSLWLEIKDSSWNDVVMKEENKKALQKDIYGFFKSEMTYKKLAISWKRGLIMYGPPGNGKTITIKVIMKTCTERGFTPLYVKSFQSIQGEEASMQSVFLKTRQLAPCVLILEDLDSLINDQNRSFFLNQLDGLEGNDGLLVIASTNHFDRLDSGLSNRPSRFDRKYLFDDPDHQERVMYARYWQDKFKGNHEISFPESLVEEVADLTQGFSFAYLKEAFVSTLVRITNVDDDERVSFPAMLKSQIMALRRELGKQSSIRNAPSLSFSQASHPLGKVMDDQISRTAHRSTTEDGNFTQRTRGPRPLPSPTELDVSDNSFSLSSTHVCKRSYHPPGPRMSEDVYPTATTVSFGSRALPQGCVLHAPPSAYPQLMPGSLPSTTSDSLQDPICATWHSAPVPSSSSHGGLDISHRNRFSVLNAPLIDIHGDVRVGEPFAPANSDA